MNLKILIELFCQEYEKIFNFKKNVRDILQAYGFVFNPEKDIIKYAIQGEVNEVAFAAVTNKDGQKQSLVIRSLPVFNPALNGQFSDKAGTYIPKGTEAFYAWLPHYLNQNGLKIVEGYSQNPLDSFFQLGVYDWNSKIMYCHLKSALDNFANPSYLKYLSEGIAKLLNLHLFLPFLRKVL